MLASAIASRAFIDFGAGRKRISGESIARIASARETAIEVVTQLVAAAIARSAFIDVMAAPFDTGRDSISS